MERARVIVPPLVTTYAIFVVMVVRAWRGPTERARRAPTTRDLVVTVVGGYLMFLAIVLVFHVALAGQRGAFRSAAWGGAVVVIGAAAVYAAGLWTEARMSRAARESPRGKAAKSDRPSRR